jgi:nucleotide-binding universal stress UspA family protein
LDQLARFWFLPNLKRKQALDVQKVIPMNHWLAQIVTDIGHLISLIGGPSTEMNRLFDAKAEQMGQDPLVGRSLDKDLKRASPGNFRSQIARESSPIHRILIPLDATHAKAPDLKPFLRLARRFDAQVTLLHCYTCPPSLDYAVGPTVLAEVKLHRNTVKKRLLELCADVRKFFAKCSWHFTSGFPLSEILRASERLQADLITVPLPLDFVSHCRTMKDLVGRIGSTSKSCPVLGIPSAK